MPGYCATCGTVNLGDFMECGGTACWWVNLNVPPYIEEPKRAA